jgi:hypothetical protein
LKAPNIELIDKALKYKNFLRFKTINHPLRQMTENILEQNNIDLNSIHIHNVSNSSFINVCIETHNELGKLFNKDIKDIANEHDSKPHIDYLKRMANIKLKNCIFLNQRQNYLVENLRRKNIVKLGELKAAKDRLDPNIFLELHQIWSSFPISWRKLINNSNRFTTYVKMKMKHVIF